MANSKQAEKRARQNKARYKLRHSQRSQTRTAVKAVRYAIEENDAAKASELLKTAEKVLANKDEGRKINDLIYDTKVMDYLKNILKINSTLI